MDFLKTVLTEMKDPIFLHLRFNHFPVILILVGAAAAVIAAFAKRDAIWRYALVSIVLAGLTAPVAYWTGTRADDRASDSELVDAEMMGKHEDSAAWAFGALAVAAVAAGLALVKPAPALRGAALVTACAAAGLTMWTAAQAGHIMHGEYTMKILDR